MTGYVRQSAADIVPGNDILAAPLNLEFNQLQTAFNATTGHNHQGGTGQGPKLILTGGAAVSGILPSANGGIGANLSAATDNSVPKINTGGVFSATGVFITDTNDLGVSGTFIQVDGAGDCAVFIGRHDGNASTPSVAFNSGAVATDYDTIIFSSGGTGSNGFGSLTYTAEAGHTFNGLITGADGFSGVGTLLSALDATNLTMGTIPPPRLISSNGFPVRTSATTWAARTITGSGDILVTNGDGVAGNPVISVTVPASFPSGTRLLFQQTTAPTGWTKDTTHNNKALRIVSGSVVNGGSTAFTSVFASRTPTGTNANTTATGDVAAVALTLAQIPGHTHTFSDSATTSTESATHTHAVSGTTSTGGTHSHTFGASNTAGGTANTWGSSDSTPDVLLPTSSAGAHNHTFSATSGGQSVLHTHSVSISGTTSSSGSGSTHDHGFTGTAHTHTWTGAAMDFAVAYVDATICVKD